ncbi:PPE family protein [Nocardia iowensis]|uniref:PPE family protein n=1 Tax=Nocardia iowensis TaxID=204891 RepID=A0ABX8RYD8_NOCIO|nr:PPE family protein [Nocardia iowensis]QXN94674.1 PPE family protein [Nocardia iowensis]
MFWFWALPPEVNSMRLFTGPGPMPMLGAAAAYKSVADGLTAAAIGAQSHVQELMATWRGPTAAKAQQAYLKHSTWLFQQAALYNVMAAKGTAQASAVSAAQATMPPLPLILANRMASAALVATNTMGQNTAPIAANEAVYMSMWAAAAGSMYGYLGQTLGNITAMPSPTVAPSITIGAPTAMEPSMLLKEFSPVEGGGVPNDAAPVDPGVSTGNPADASGSTPDPAAVTPDLVQEELPITESVLPQDPYDDLAGSAGTGAEPLGFFGTSPTSPTLAGLQGGMGSMVAIGMTNGGLGALSGASTGYRLPSNWPAGSGTAFGPAPGAAAAAPVAQSVPPRSATASGARIRHRRDENGDSTTLFDPNRATDVPALEKSVVVGVIEYVDDEQPH